MQIAEGNIVHINHPIMGFFVKFLVFVLLLSLIIAAGLDFYILYLLNQPMVDTGRARKFCGITGGYTIALAVIYVVALVVMSFTGSTARLLRHPKSLAFLVVFLILTIVVASLNFAAMPVLKSFEEAGGSVAASMGATGSVGTTGTTNSTGSSNVAEESLKRAKVLIIAGGGVGLGIIVLYLVFYAIKGLTSRKKEKKVEQQKASILSAGEIQKQQQAKALAAEQAAKEAQKKAIIEAAEKKAISNALL